MVTGYAAVMKRYLLQARESLGDCAPPAGCLLWFGFGMCSNAILSRGSGQCLLFALLQGADTNSQPLGCDSLQGLASAACPCSTSRLQDTSPPLLAVSEVFQVALFGSVETTWQS